MPGIPLPWQVVIGVLVIAGTTALLAMLGRDGTRGGVPGRDRVADGNTDGESAGMREAPGQPASTTAP